MKMIFVSFMMILLLAGCVSGDSNTGSYEENIHVLDERFFAMQVMEIFQNQDDFLGRTIRYEGIFRSFYLPMAGGDIFIVYRYIDGCCGPEPAGLQVYLNDIEPFPDDTWVEVTGVFTRVEGDERSTLLLDVISLVEKIN